MHPSEALGSGTYRIAAMHLMRSPQHATPVQDMDAAAVLRDDSVKAAGEAQLGALAAATARKEQAGVERMLVIEGALREVATAAASALAELQVNGCFCWGMGGGEVSCRRTLMQVVARWEL
jgi:hypothetical protein